MKCAIGIDPDSRGVVCALVNAETTQVITRGFLATQEGLTEMLRWVSKQGQVLVALEGTHGQSQPIEKAFREAAILFYSFRPGDTDKFRKAVLGQNKDNQRDAESVARYALALESQGRLERYKRVWFPDMNLQLLTRRWESLSRQITAEVNRLWKLLRYASVDLYLALGGNNPQVDCQEQKALKNQGLLTLLASQPDIGTWKTSSDEQLLQAMGGGNYKGRATFIAQLRPLMQAFPTLPSSLALLLKSSALQIQRFRDEQVDIRRALEDLSLLSLPTQTLRSLRGLGITTASILSAEIIDVRRFPAEDSLACYSGLGMNEHSTGQTVRMLPTRQFNHRLKDAFMTAALNYVKYNPDSHLAGYHRNLIRKGMDRTQATKRVARALVRVVYRLLSGLVMAEDCPSQQNSKGGESEVASGQRRSDTGRSSNTSPSTPKESKAKRTSEVKASISKAVTVRVRRKRRALPKKTA